MNAPLWTRDAAVAATGGESTRDWQASGISIDTRSLNAGDLFVALKDVRDGHDFVSQALAAGAAAALVSHRPDGVADDAPLLIVSDVLAALGDMARARRAATRARVVAVTGSVGKTSTKEMLRTILSHQGRVHAAEKSFNNHWGVPLTLARMPVDADFAVIEIGMNHPGEIAPLARMSAPDVAVVTTVAAAHLAAFDDVAAIAREKAAIFTGLAAGGVAILNGDIDTAPILRREAERHAGNVQSFGQGDGADYRLSDVRLTQEATIFRLGHEGREFPVKIATPGRHFAMNGAAALAAARALGADQGLAVGDLGRWTPFDGRGVREMIVIDRVDPDCVIQLIDDAYNANPTSVAAALEVLAVTVPRHNVGRVSRGRRIAILGDMLELGPQSPDMHAALADHPAMQDIDLVHTVGPDMAALWQALPAGRRGQHHDASAGLAPVLHDILDAGDVVLVKGSLGMKMAIIIDAIRKLGHSVPAKL